MRQLRLNTLQNTRRTYARLLRARLTGEIDRETYRDLIYGFASFLNLWKLETTEELQARIENIENELEQRNIRRLS